MKKSVLILGAVLLAGTTAGAGEPDLAVLIDWMTTPASAGYGVLPTPLPK